MEGKILYFETGKAEPELLDQVKAIKLAVIEADDHIDPHFFQHCETNKLGDKSISFASINGEIGQMLSTEETTDKDIQIRELFQKAISPKEASQETDLNVEIQKFKDATLTAFFKVDEKTKRLSKMTESLGREANFPIKRTLVVNPKAPLIQNILDLHEKAPEDPLVTKLCQHIADLATLSGQGLDGAGKENLVRRGQELMQVFTERFIAQKTL